MSSQQTQKQSILSVSGGLGRKIRVLDSIKRVKTSKTPTALGFRAFFVIRHNYDYTELGFFLEIFGRETRLLVVGLLLESFSEDINVPSLLALVIYTTPPKFPREI